MQFSASTPSETNMTVHNGSTLVDLLQTRAAHFGDRVAYIFLRDSGDQAECMTWSALDLCARKYAAMLQQHAIQGDRALILYPQGLDYIAAFLGCLYAGIVAVPAYPPRMTRLKHGHERLRSIIQSASPTVALV